MSKLFYRLNSLSTYLKSNKLLDEIYEPIVFKSKSDSEIIEEYMKLLLLLDNSYNVPCNEKYKEFIDEYNEDLINIHKGNIAAYAIKKLYETNKAPLSHYYVYEHIELDDDLKPCLNLRTPPPKKLGEKYLFKIILEEIFENIIFKEFFFIMLYDENK
jgi:hypothetical protein